MDETDRAKVRDFGDLLIGQTNLSNRSDRVVLHLLRLDVNDTWRWTMAHPETLHRDLVAA